MRRISFLVLFQVAVMGFLSAQTDELFLKSADKGLYVDHKVTPKENFYSIGRMFNAPAKSIASFNGLDMSKGLSIGQVIQIPLSDENFSQAANQGVPVYAKAGQKESLAHISSSNNKVSLENLRFWNDISGDNSGNKTKLIVGFITSGEILQGNSIVINKKEAPVNVPVVKNEKPQENKKTEPEKNNTVAKEENKTEVVEQPKKEVPKMEQTQMPESGYFKNDFEQQVKTFPLSKDETVTSGIFKTTSGWKEAKYYALLDGVQPGTIVKITNPTNNKLVYAKVLGQMSGIRQNQGLDLRISDAAVAALDISETDKFIVKINY